MSKRDVVVTGYGLTTPLGKNVGENWLGITEMKTGIIHCPKDNTPEFLLYMGKVLEYDLPQEIPPKQRGQMKFLNRGSLLGFCATSEAIQDSQQYIASIDPGRRSLYVASGDFTKVGFDFMYPAIKDAVDSNWETVDYEVLNNSALDKVTPFFLLESLHNNLFSFLSAYIQFMGPNTSLASLSPCGSNALELAYRSILLGKADIALAVGYGNWITEVPLYELDGLGILSKCKSGVTSYKPFDKKRDGFIPGEGGAAILLENAEKASERGAPVMATLKGFANSIEFISHQNISVPPKVSKHNILAVLQETGIEMSEIAFIIPHGSGTKKGDSSELHSIIDLIDRSQKNIPLCGLKPYTGHMGAASDIAEVIIGINAARENTVPATLNFDESDKEFSSLKIVNSHQISDKNKFLSISYGIGGQSSSVIVEVN